MHREFHTNEYILQEVSLTTTDKLPTPRGRGIEHKQSYDGKYAIEEKQLPLSLCLGEKIA